MTGNAINAKSDELSSEELDAVSGGMNVLLLPLAAFSCRSQEGGVRGVRTIRPKCFNRLCSNSPRADKRAGCG